MIFLYEKQIDISPDCLDGYRECHILQEAKYQYEFLYQLDDELFEKVDEIHFLYSGPLDLAEFKNILTNYSADIELYKNSNLFRFVYETRPFPSEKFLEDNQKRLRIQQLIKQQRFVNFKDTKYKYLPEIINQDKLIFLKYRKDLLSDIMNKSNGMKNLHLFAHNYNMIASKSDGITHIHTDIYLQIESILREIRSKLHISPESDVLRFLPPGSKSYLKNELLNHFITSRDRKSKRCQIIGEDMFLLHAAAELIFGTKYYYVQDLLEGIQSVNEIVNELLFKNLHVLRTVNEYKMLDELLLRFQNVILHSNYYRDIKYFSSFRRLDLPDNEKIRQRLTSLFIALLTDNDRFMYSDPDSYPFYQHLMRRNLLLPLLKECKDLFDLQTIIQQLEKIENNSLLTDPLLWYYLVDGIKKANSKKEQKKNIPHKTIKLIFNGRSWRFEGLNGVEKTEGYDLLGCYGVAILIYSYTQGHTGLTYDNLRMMLDDLSLQSNKIIKRDRNASSRESLVKIFSAFREKNKEFENFYKMHIKCKQGRYWFQPSNEISYEVEHNYLNQKFNQKYFPSK